VNTSWTGCIFVQLEKLTPIFGIVCLFPIVAFCITAVLPYNIDALFVVLKSFDFWYLFGGQLFATIVWCGLYNWDLRCATIWILFILTIPMFLIDAAPEIIRRKAKIVLSIVTIMFFVFTGLLYFGTVPNLSQRGISFAAYSASYRELFHDRLVTFLIFMVRFVVQLAVFPDQLMLVNARVKHFYTDEEAASEAQMSLAGENDVA